MAGVLKMITESGFDAELCLLWISHLIYEDVFIASVEAPGARQKNPLVVWFVSDGVMSVFSLYPTCGRDNFRLSSYCVVM